MPHCGALSLFRERGLIKRPRLLRAPEGLYRIKSHFMESLQGFTLNVPDWVMVWGHKVLPHLKDFYSVGVHYVKTETTIL